ncbi:MAG: pantoate--beta-alanine ligase [Candidatus Pedobacter colombiensis]|uniref:Pantothenate synthetase n=1 Tax=Candidatus Pedobacter colombiensis TaxID=3121371 RepID=A0AAJ6B8T4_9SPHI|nr:pantoate--beta-alanine ligase [Pedobacter sp.]WEK19473.1 MAG: pantoate--beta-alanine ligase [Pedobacter sp.]
MKVINTIAALKSLLEPIKLAQQKIALVPTMGALHKGHVSLIKIAQQQADVVVCSIFVNPTQFTDPKDLEKYPRPLEHDMKMLQEAGCNVVFMPSVTEMYPQPETWHIDLGPAEFLLEGEFRKGHYQGVTQIVKKLFDAVNPDVAFFGQKDFQQVLMIKNMVAVFNMPVQIVSCPIIREDDGLAMSSRNIHLSFADRENALVLSKALLYVQDNFSNKSIPALLEEAKKLINETPGVELDYFTIANGDTLLPEEDKKHHNIVALVAAKVGETRLIDNMILN